MNRSLDGYHFEINESFQIVKYMQIEIYTNRKAGYDTLVLFLVETIPDNKGHEIFVLKISYVSLMMG
jgi:hypothetical protein